MAKWTPEDPERFRNYILETFEVETRIYDGFDLRKKLWHAMVSVAETCDGPGEYESFFRELIGLAIARGLKERETLSTWRSAERRVFG